MKYLLLAGLLLAPAAAAHATMINTYDFTQGGYVVPHASGPGVLSGSFTGAVEADGYIGLADLSSLSVTFSYPTGGATIGVYGYGPTNFFSFSTTGGASTLDLDTSFAVGGVACVGAVAAFGFGSCATAGLPGPVNGYAVGAYTADLARVTLVSSVVTSPPPAPTQVPEPPGFAVLATAGLALLVLRRRQPGMLRR